MWNHDSVRMPTPGLRAVTVTSKLWPLLGLLYPPSCEKQHLARRLRGAVAKRLRREPVRNGSLSTMVRATPASGAALARPRAHSRLAGSVRTLLMPRCPHCAPDRATARDCARTGGVCGVHPRHEGEGDHRAELPWRCAHVRGRPLCAARAGPWARAPSARERHWDAAPPTCAAAAPRRELRRARAARGRCRPAVPHGRGAARLCGADSLGLATNAAPTL